MPLVDSVYTSAVGHGMPAILLRALVAGSACCRPTFLMGASLPAASRWIKASPEGVGMLGMLYGANTVGAVIGCLLAGFYLLRVFDMAHRDLRGRGDQRHGRAGQLLARQIARRSTRRPTNPSPRSPRAPGRST